MNAVLMILGIALYFVPSIVAAARQHRNGVPIGLLNIFLGWTFIGWVLALVWAFTANTTKPQPEAPRLVKCSECAELIQPDAKRCRHCGAAVGTPRAPACPDCGRVVALSDDYCPVCGFNLH